MNNTNKRKRLTQALDTLFSFNLEKEKKQRMIPLGSEESKKFKLIESLPVDLQVKFFSSWDRDMLLRFARTSSESEQLIRKLLPDIVAYRYKEKEGKKTEAESERDASDSYCNFVYNESNECLWRPSILRYPFIGENYPRRLLPPVSKTQKEEKNKYWNFSCQDYCNRHWKTWSLPFLQDLIQTIENKQPISFRVQEKDPQTLYEFEQSRTGPTFEVTGHINYLWIRTNDGQYPGSSWLFKNQEFTSHDHDFFPSANDWLQDIVRQRNLSLQKGRVQNFNVTFNLKLSENLPKVMPPLGKQFESIAQEFKPKIGPIFSARVEWMKDIFSFQVLA
jgi:hypothetical protein